MIHPVSGEQIVGLVIQNTLFAEVFRVFCVVTWMQAIKIPSCAMLADQFFNSREP